MIVDRVENYENKGIEIGQMIILLRRLLVSVETWQQIYECNYISSNFGKLDIICDEGM